jgi:hypothetical protein
MTSRALLAQTRTVSILFPWNYRSFFKYFTDYLEPKRGAEGEGRESRKAIDEATAKAIAGAGNSTPGEFLYLVTYVTPSILNISAQKNTQLPANGERD